MAVVGKSLESYFEVGMNLGYLTIEDDIVIPVEDIEKYDDDKVVIIVTGNKGEPLDALVENCSENIIKIFKLKKQIRFLLRLHRHLVWKFRCIKR